MRLTPPNHALLKSGHDLQTFIGGAELNALSALANFGHDTDMITTLPNNPLGQYAKSEMRKRNVGLHYLNEGSGRLGLYFMEEGYGNRSGKVFYDREHSLFAEQGAELLENIKLDSNDVFLFTGITLALSEEIRSQCLSLLKKLHEAGTTVVFDINYRESLWGIDLARSTVKSVLPYVDVLFCGKRDATDLLKTNDESDNMEKCTKTIANTFQIPYVCSSNRDTANETIQGCMYANGTFYQSAPIPYTALNRIGAGDAFMAGILHGLKTNSPLEDIPYFATKCDVLQHTTNEDILDLDVDDIMNWSGKTGELKR